MVTVKDTLAEFSFFRPQAQRVYIVGDFNGWRENELPMTRRSDGTWVASVHLPPGDFKFRYRADGQWYIDYAAFGVECGDFGLDSVVHISSKAVHRKPKPVKPPSSDAGRKARTFGSPAVRGRVPAGKSAVA